MSRLAGLSVRVQQTFMRLSDHAGSWARALSLAAQAPPSRDRKPVIFFHATTRINGYSLNAGFSQVASLALRTAGVPVIHFVCRAGMSRCVLGTDPDRPQQDPPCSNCIRQSRLEYRGARTEYFSFRQEADLAAALSSASLADLMQFTHREIPLGAIALPALRWRFRVHHLVDDEATRSLYRQFIASAWSVAVAFTALLDREQPQAVVLFNGQFFPEATARYLAMQRGIRTITHEVGLQPVSAYFTTGEATAYPIAIPESFDLNAEQNARLDAYLENRFQGKFSMAGVQFWPEMKGLSREFLDKAAGFKQIVPVFTNVIFDTSQPHSNVVFPDMFTWLDLVLRVAKHHPETLFVLRAHPDESRPGKASRESVAMWVERSRAAELPNLVFVPSDEFISSYELIQRAKFVMIYNSTIGLEASILGAPVLCAGKARFTQYPTVYFPTTQEDYRNQFYSFLSAEIIPVPSLFRRNARRFLYYQLFRTSLPFGDFLEQSGQRGYVRIRPGLLKRLRCGASPVIHTVLDGILDDGDFLLEEG